MDNKDNENIKEIPVVEADNNVVFPEDIDGAVHNDEENLNQQVEQVNPISKEQQLQYNDQQKISAQEVNENIEEKQEVDNHGSESKTSEQNDNQEQLNNNEEGNNKTKGGPSGFKRVMAVILFLLFFAIIWFMPEINKFISEYKSSKEPAKVITTGISTCTLSKTTKNLDVNITATFSIINSKLTKLNYVTVTKGDKTEDSEELTKLYSDCRKLKEFAGELDGITISCSSNNGNVVNKQILDYEKLDSKKVTAAYAEAGGIYPEFKKGENIDKIESKMIASKYKCKRS